MKLRHALAKRLGLTVPVPHARHKQTVKLVYEYKGNNRRGKRGKPIELIGFERAPDTHAARVSADSRGRQKLARSKAAHARVRCLGAYHDHTIGPKAERMPARNTDLHAVAHKRWVKQVSADASDKRFKTKAEVAYLKDFGALKCRQQKKKAVPLASAVIGQHKRTGRVQIIADDKGNLEDLKVAGYDCKGVSTAQITRYYQKMCEHVRKLGLSEIQIAQLRANKDVAHPGPCVIPKSLTKSRCLRRGKTLYCPVCCNKVESLPNKKFVHAYSDEEARNNRIHVLTQWFGIAYPKQVPNRTQQTAIQRMAKVLNDLDVHCVLNASCPVGIMFFQRCCVSDEVDIRGPTSYPSFNMERALDSMLQEVVVDNCKGCITAFQVSVPTCTTTTTTTTTSGSTPTTSPCFVGKVVICDDSVSTCPTKPTPITVKTIVSTETDGGCVAVGSGKLAEVTAAKPQSKPTSGPTMQSVAQAAIPEDLLEQLPNPPTDEPVSDVPPPIPPRPRDPAADFEILDATVKPNTLWGYTFAHHCTRTWRGLLRKAVPVRTAIRDYDGEERLIQDRNIQVQACPMAIARYHPTVHPWWAYLASTLLLAGVVPMFLYMCPGPKQIIEMVIAWVVSCAVAIMITRHKEQPRIAFVRVIASCILGEGPSILWGGGSWWVAICATAVALALACAFYYVTKPKDDGVIDFIPHALSAVLAEGPVIPNVLDMQTNYSSRYRRICSGLPIPDIDAVEYKMGTYYMALKACAALSQDFQEGNIRTVTGEALFRSPPRRVLP